MTVRRVLPVLTHALLPFGLPQKSPFQPNKDMEDAVAAAHEANPNLVTVSTAVLNSAVGECEHGAEWGTWGYSGDHPGDDGWELNRFYMCERLAGLLFHVYQSTGSDEFWTATYVVFNYAIGPHGMPTSFNPHARQDFIDELTQQFPAG